MFSEKGWRHADVPTVLMLMRQNQMFPYRYIYWLKRCGYFLTGHMDLLSSEMLIFSLYFIIALEHGQFLEQGPHGSLCAGPRNWLACASHMNRDTYKSWGLW